MNNEVIQNLDQIKQQQQTIKNKIKKKKQKKNTYKPQPHIILSNFSEITQRKTRAKYNGFKQGALLGFYKTYGQGRRNKRE